MRWTAPAIRRCMARSLSLLKFNRRGEITIGSTATNAISPMRRRPNRPRTKPKGSLWSSGCWISGADPNAATRHTTPGPLGAGQGQSRAAGLDRLSSRGPHRRQRQAGSILMAAQWRRRQSLAQGRPYAFSIAPMSNDLPALQAMVGAWRQCQDDLQSRRQDARSGRSPRPRSARTKPRCISPPFQAPTDVIAFLVAQGVPTGCQERSWRDGAEIWPTPGTSFAMLGPRKRSAIRTNPGPMLVRETQTSDAFKKAMGTRKGRQ